VALHKTFEKESGPRGAGGPAARGEEEGLPPRRLQTVKKEAEHRTSHKPNQSKWRGPGAQTIQFTEGKAKREKEPLTSLLTLRFDETDQRGRFRGEGAGGGGEKKDGTNPPAKL